MNLNHPRLSLAAVLAGVLLAVSTLEAADVPFEDSLRLPLVDPSFRTDYWAALSDTHNAGRVLVLAEEKAGTILVGGAFDRYGGHPSSGLVRLLVNGEIDPTFQPSLRPPWGSISMRAMVVQNDGMIVVAGLFDAIDGVSRPGLARLKPDGTLDASFDPGQGATTLDAMAAIPSVRWLGLGPDGTLFVAGRFDRFNGTPRNSVARLLSNGSVDPAFTPELSPAKLLNTGLVLADGSLLVGGGLHFEPGQELAKLLADGSRDKTFKSNLAIEGSLTFGPSVRALAADVAGRIYVGGDFTSIQGMERRQLARLLPDGSLDTAFVATALPREPADGGSVTWLDLDETGILWVAGSTGNSSVKAAYFFGAIGEDGARKESQPLLAHEVIGGMPGLEGGLLLADGRILVRGNSVGATGLAPVPRLIRLVGNFKGSMLVWDSSGDSVSEAERAVQLKLWRGGRTDGELTVKYATQDDSAVAGQDYAASTGTLTFASGETSKSLTLDLLPDALGEAPEKFRVLLSDPAGPRGALIANPVKEIKILDNDSGFAFVMADALNASEAAGQIQLTVERGSDLGAPVSVGFKTIETTARTSADFVFAEGRLEFAAGEATKTFSITILDDREAESAETFRVELFNPSTGTSLGATSTAVILIQDDELEFELFPRGWAVSNPLPHYFTDSVSEGAGGFQVQVVRRGDRNRSASVKFMTLDDGTAIAGMDYEPVARVIEFGTNTTVQFVIVKILNDRLLEPQPDRSRFRVAIAEPSPGATIGLDHEWEIVIQDDETGFSFNPAESNEGFVIVENFGTRTIRVQRGFDSVEEVSVEVRALSDQAREGIDFTLLSPQRLVFAPGQLTNSVIVQIINDEMFELDESFRLQLIEPSKGTRIDWPQEKTLTIRDNDPGFYFRDPPLGKEAGKTVSVVVFRTQGLDRELSVDIATRDESALAGEDYVSARATLTFLAGEREKRFPIEILDDALVENEEILSVSLSNPTGGAGIGSPFELRVRIEDDENLYHFESAGQYRESNTNAAVRVVRSGSRERESSVEIVAIAESAKPGQDYDGFPRRISFAIGELSKPVLLGLINDSIPEHSETFRLRLANPSPGSGVAPDRAEFGIQINDDDVPPSVIEFESAIYEANELDGEARIYLKRSTEWGGANVRVTARIGTATNGIDYIFANEQWAYFGQGSVRSWVSIPLLEDGMIEPIESFQISLGSVQSDDPQLNSARLGDLRIAEVRIFDAGRVIEFTSANYWAMESNHVASIQVRRRGDLAVASSVRYRTIDWHAIASQDFEAAIGELNFAAGQAAADIRVPIHNDYFAEGDERFKLVLEAPTAGFALGKISESSVTIGDDERPTVTDPGFAAGIHLPPNGNSHISAIEPLANGGALVAGYFQVRTTGEFRRLARLQSDGSVDTTFKDGSAALQGVTSIASIRSLANGQCVVAFNLQGTNQFQTARLVRCSQDGALDSAFSQNAEFTRDAEWASIAEMLIQPDGRIVIAGEFTRVGGVARNGIARLLPDGNLDSSFDPREGPVFRPPWNPSVRQIGVRAMTLASDGRIVIGGQFTSYAGAQRLGVARLNSDGSLDPSFDANAGLIRLEESSGQSFAEVAWVALQSDGKVLVSGQFNRAVGQVKHSAARLLADGKLDPSFDAGVTPGGWLNRLVPRADGRIWMTGGFESTNGGLRRNLALLNSDGSATASFRGSSQLEAVERIAVLADGNLLGVGGGTDSAGIYSQTLFRTGDQSPAMNVVHWSSANPRFTEGQPGVEISVSRTGDTTLPMDVTFSMTPGTAEAGKDFAAGFGQIRFEAGESLKRFRIEILDDGFLEKDESFDLELTGAGTATLAAQGRTLHATIADNEAPMTIDSSFSPDVGPNASKLIPLADGALLILGQFPSVATMTRIGIARLLPDGSLDRSFDAKLGLDSETDCCVQVRDAAVQSDGKIVVAGYFTRVGGIHQPGLARLNPNGSLDQGFNQYPEIDGEWNWIQRLALQPDGKVLAAGWGSRLRRFNTDGSLDASFARFAEGTFPGDVQGLWVLNDGNIIVSGYFEQISDVPRWHVARLNAAGVLDPGFVPARVDTVTGGYSDQAVDVSPEGAVYMSGVASGTFGDSALLVKLRPDGSIDPEFRADFQELRIGSWDFIAKQAADRSVWVLGRRSDSNDEWQDRLLMRLKPNGALDTEFIPISFRGNFYHGWGFGRSSERSNMALHGNEIAYILNVHAVNTVPSPKIVKIQARPQAARGIEFAFAKPMAGENQKQIEIEIRRRGDVSESASVVVSVHPEGTAQVGRDFEWTPTTLRFAPLESSKQIEIPLIDNAARGNDLTFSLLLSDASLGTSIGRNRLAATILDDDVRGALDLGFHADLASIENGANFANVQRIRMLDDGRFQVWGNFQWVQGARRDNFAQFLPNGTLDTTNHPPVQPPWPQFNGDGAVLPGGGSYTPDGEFLRRQLPDGTWDPAYRLAVRDGAWSIRTLVKAGDGKTIVGGAFTRLGGFAAVGIGRLNAAGQPDPDFRNLGVYNQSQNGEVLAAHVLDDGRVLIAGNFTRVDGQARHGLARLNANGAIDSSFPAGSSLLLRNSSINTFAVDKAGAIYVAGRFPGLSTGDAQLIVKLRGDGSLDYVLDIGPGPVRREHDGQDYASSIDAMALDAGGGLLVGGGFNYFDGVPSAGLVRLKPGGGRPTVLEILSARRTESGAFVVRVACSLGRQYTLESSSDLANWTRVKTQTPLAPEADFIDTTQTLASVGKRFYRIRQLDPP